jgi:hypothetical protein
MHVGTATATTAGRPAGESWHAKEIPRRGEHSLAGGRPAADRRPHVSAPRLTPSSFTVSTALQNRSSSIVLRV